MGTKPQLTKLRQKRGLLSAEECCFLAVKERQFAFIREIKMGNGSQNWLFARTVAPEKTLSGSAKRISILNDTPLGKVLFGRNGAKRSSMSIELSEDMPKTLLNLDVDITHPLWQRRSIFEFSTGPLLVLEIFLPDCPIYVN